MWTVMECDNRAKFSVLLFLAVSQVWSTRKVLLSFLLDMTNNEGFASMGTVNIPSNITAQNLTLSTSGGQNQPSLSPPGPTERPTAVALPEPPPDPGIYKSAIEVRHNVKEEFKDWMGNIFENSVAVDITFESINVSVTDAHVHMGAVDAKGQPWFVYDVTSLRRNPPPFNSSGVNATATCEEDDLYPTTENLQILPPYPTERPPIRLLCTIYSVEPYHEPKISAMRETWAPKCDGFLVASNKTDPSYDAVNLLRRGPDSYDNMWQKVQAIWGYIYDNFYNDFDWFHLGGDDMWILVENLRYYLNSDEIHLAQTGGRTDLPSHLQFPLYLGEPLSKGGGTDMYNTGGPGYLLNRAALKLLVHDILPSSPTSGRRTSEEDLYIAAVFRTFKANPVFPYPTIDGDLRNRFNTFNPHRLYVNNIPFWYKKFGNRFIKLLGRGSYSNASVAFHYVKPEELRRQHYLKYICPKALRC